MYEALFLHALEQAEKRGENDLEAVRRFSIPIVGETYDGYLNDIRASVIDRGVVDQAIAAAETQVEVLEGNHGGGAGMICHGYKGGTGTSSRIIPGVDKDYVLGVLVQANYGKKEDFRVGNVPIGKLLMEEDQDEALVPGGVAAAAKHELPAGGKAVEGSEHSI